jgi:hypothetical protein
MAEYSFSPQFANLTGLQPVHALDVTRGANLEFRPLDRIQIMSSQPELIAQSIAGAVTDIAKGALGGITANFEKKEEEEREKRKFAHELMLYGVKEKSENADFFAKEEARWIAENSGKPGFAQNLARFRKAYSGFSDRVPETKVETEPSDFETIEPPLPEEQPDVKAEFVTPEEIPQDRPGVFSWRPTPRMPKETQPLSAIPVSTVAAEPVAPALEKLPQAEQQPQPTVVTTEKKPITGVDYTEYDQPITPDKRFETDAEAQNFAARLNKQLKEINPDWKYEVNNLGKEDAWKTLTPVSVRDERIKREEAKIKEEAKAIREQQQLDIAISKEAREAKEAEEKSVKISDTNVNQYKSQVQLASSTVKEINDLIKLIKENPNTATGGWSTKLMMFPGNNAAKIARGMIKTIYANVAFNQLMEIKKGGAGLGALDAGEREALASTEGSFDLDNLPSEYIIPRLEQLRDARLKVIDSTAKDIQKVDPEFKIPALEYPKPSKKKTKKDTTQEIAQAGSVPVIKSQEEFDKLPSGSKFTYPGSSKIETKK